MKFIESTFEKAELKLSRITIQQQKKLIESQRRRLKRHENLIKKVMKELGYNDVQIQLYILANYKDKEDAE